jgi:hypothetical protein
VQYFHLIAKFFSFNRWKLNNDCELVGGVVDGDLVCGSKLTSSPFDSEALQF